jgi:copper chaperone NosL
MGIVGLYDFYLWEYDYGHNLDPRAIIKIEGMSYQPPLIGSEKLLNFTATSLPSWGMLIIATSIILMAVTIIIEKRHVKV